MKVKDFLEMLNEHDPEMDIINPIVGITEVIIVHHTGEVIPLDSEWETIRDHIMRYIANMGLFTHALLIKEAV